MRKQAQATTVANVSQPQPTLDYPNASYSNMSDAPQQHFSSTTKSTPQLDQAPTPALNMFGKDLTHLATTGQLDPVIGRDKEIERLAQILSRRKKKQCPTRWRARRR